MIRRLRTVPRLKQRNVHGILSQCLDAENQPDSSMKVTTKLDDFDPKECLSLLSKSACQLSIYAFPLCTPGPRWK